MESVLTGTELRGGAEAVSGHGVGPALRILCVLPVLLTPGLGAGAQVGRRVRVGSGCGCGPAVRVEALCDREGGKVGRDGVHVAAVGAGVLGGGRVLLGPYTRTHSGQSEEVESRVCGSYEGTWRRVVE